MCSLYLKRAVEAPCCVGSRGASFGTPCHYICVTLMYRICLAHLQNQMHMV
jgi:hypothetical protein